MTSNPKIFISHATEDKERFVLEFAEKLQSKGVKVWYDEWEIKYGDSIVSKIFDGIEECDVFLIILSETSIQKPWVKEELNSGLIRRIEEDARIIPVVIDGDIKIPTSINHLRRMIVTDLNNYDTKFEELIGLLHDYDTSPPLNEPPKFLKQINIIPGHTRIDSTVLRTIGEIVIDTEEEFIEYSELKNRLNELDITEEHLNDSLEILDSESYIKIDYVCGGLEHSPIRLMCTGFWDYFKSLADYEDIYKSISSAIYNEEKTWDIHVADIAGSKTIIVNYIFKYFENMGYVNIPKVHMGGIVMIGEITVQGKRYFNQLLS